MSKLLINENPLQVLPSLAVKTSLNEAIILQQIHYWLEKSEHIHENKKWIYNSIENWCLQFPFFSKRTIERTIKQLCDRGLLIKGNFNRSKFDKTSWYSIDYEVLNELEKDNDNMESSIPPKWRDGECHSDDTNTIDYITESTNTDNEVHTLNKFNGEVHTSVPEKQKPSKNTFDELKAKGKDMVNRFSGICESHIDDLVIRDTVRNVFCRYINLYNLYTCRIHPILTTETLINVCITLSTLCNDYNHFDVDDIYKPDESGFTGLDNMLSAHFSRNHRKDTNYSITHFANAEYLGKLAESVIEY